MLESAFLKGEKLRENLKKVKKTKTDTIPTVTYSIPDYRPFVTRTYFSKVIPKLYSHYSSDEKFIKKIWNLTIQLTTYHRENEEIPRLPLETLLGGGGDCEDLSILFASMLKATPENYRIYLVFIDSKHPQKLEHPNHVMVKVEAEGGYETFVELGFDGMPKPSYSGEISPYENIRGLFLRVD